MLYRVGTIFRGIHRVSERQISRRSIFNERETKKIRDDAFCQGVIVGSLISTVWAFILFDKK